MNILRVYFNYRSKSTKIVDFTLNFFSSYNNNRKNCDRLNLIKKIACATRERKKSKLT